MNDGLTKLTRLGQFKNLSIISLFFRLDRPKCLKDAFTSFFLLFQRIVVLKRKVREINTLLTPPHFYKHSRLFNCYWLNCVGGKDKAVWKKELVQWKLFRMVNLLLMCCYKRFSKRLASISYECFYYINKLSLCNTPQPKQNVYMTETIIAVIFKITY